MGCCKSKKKAAQVAPQPQLPLYQPGTAVSLPSVADSEEYEISIDRQEGTKLGLDINTHKQSGHLIITGVSEEGLVSEWNSTCDEKFAVRKGDAIIEVDGKRTDLVNECMKNQTLHLKLTRAKDKCSRTFKLYHGTSMTAAKKIMESGFTESTGGELGRGIYFVDEKNIDKAKRFAHDEFHRAKGTARQTSSNEPALLECAVKINRHVKANRPDKSGDWRRQGYDACYTDKTSASKSTEWCISKPELVEVVRITDLREEACPWSGGKYCPYTTNCPKVANAPWGGSCPCVGTTTMAPAMSRLSCASSVSTPASTLRTSSSS